MVPTPDYTTGPADRNSTPQRTLCVHAASHVPSARMKPTFLIEIKGKDALLFVQLQGGITCDRLSH